MLGVTSKGLREFRWAAGDDHRPRARVLFVDEPSHLAQVELVASVTIVEVIDEDELGQFFRAAREGRAKERADGAGFGPEPDHAAPGLDHRLHDLEQEHAFPDAGTSDDPEDVDSCEGCQRDLFRSLLEGNLSRDHPIGARHVLTVSNSPQRGRAPDLEPRRRTRDRRKILATRDMAQALRCRSHRHEAFRDLIANLGGSLGRDAAR